MTGRGIRINGGVVAGGILNRMNIKGNPSTLVASHPGNTNAVKYGVHSPRFLQSRATEIVAHLTESFEFSVVQRIAVEQVGRFVAILEAIDRDLDERGLVDKRGEAPTETRAGARRAGSARTASARLGQERSRHEGSPLRASARRRSKSESGARLWPAISLRAPFKHDPRHDRSFAGLPTSG